MQQHHYLDRYATPSEGPSGFCRACMAEHNKGHHMVRRIAKALLPPSPLVCSPYVANWVAVSTMARCTVGTTPLQADSTPQQSWLQTIWRQDGRCRCDAHANSIMLTLHKLRLTTDNK
jgi:hypothetical protein